jgi:hypothetical protein
MPENTTQEVSEIQTVISLAERYPLTGTYRGIMTQVKNMLLRLTSLDETAAHMAGHACGCEIGRLTSERRTVQLADIKIGKVSKDGTITLREASAKIKGIYLTNALLLVKVLGAVVEVEQLGAEIHKLDLPSSVAQWIEKLGK